jgi:ABC-type nitrate/sulfonate/bicarbonate transport system ATPase subunit
MFIQCKDLTYRYPGASAEVFQNLNFRISGPGFHSLFGPSGVGKTTLARIMAGEIPVSPSNLTENNIGQTFYSYNLERLPGWHTVGEHLESVSSSSNRDKISDLIGLFGLQSCLHSRFTHLSLGQQNRANLLRYLLQDFGCLIMDESLANVDEATREVIILKIKEMFPGKTFVYISHNIQEVAKLCKKILVLRGSHRTPQTLCIEGRDHQAGKPTTKNSLEQTILEVIDAA